MHSYRIFNKKSFTHIHHWLFLLFFCSISLTSVPSFAENKTVFILHSYHQEYPWTRNQHTGFIKTLSEQSTAWDTNVSTEYLDTKRVNFDSDYQLFFFNYLQKKFSNYSPDVIYCSDDNGLVFLLHFKDKLFGDVPVVFSGINNTSITKSLNRLQYSGVFEKKEIAPNLALLKKIVPHPGTIIFLGDGSSTDLAIKQSIQNDIATHFPGQKYALWGENRLSTIIQKLQNHNNGTIFLTTIGGIKNDQEKIIPLKEIISSIAAAGNFTILSMEDVYMEPEVLGGYVTSGLSQGAEAAKIAVAIIGGSSTEDIPLVKDSPNEFMFNYPQLQKLGIASSGLPKGSILLNRPQSLYEQYKYWIWPIAFFLLLQTIIILFLTKNIQKRKKAEASLHKIRNELEQRVELRTQELKESEKTFRSIIESSPMGAHFFELSPDGNLIFTGYNPAADTILGTPNSQFLNQNIIDAFPALSNTEIPDRYKEVCKTGIPWQTDHVVYEDNKVQGVFAIHAFQTSTGKMATFFRDTTEKHRMIETLAQSEERMQLALKAADIAIWDWHIPTGATYFSPTYFSMLGYLPGELETSLDTWTSLLHEDDREETCAVIRECMKAQKAWDLEFRLISKDGLYRWIRGHGDIVEVDSDGKTLRAAGTHLDITDEKISEAILKKSEATLKSIVIAAPVGIGLIHERVFSWVSERIAEMTGYKAEELIGKSARILYPSEEEFKRAGKVKYDQLKSESVGEVNTLWKKKSGELINIHLRSAPVDHTDFRLGVTFSALDITQRLQDEANVHSLELQVQQTKNIESLGVLAGGIAHDFNNILMAVLGNLSLVRQVVPQGSREYRLISAAEKASLRARGLTKQLLTFSKGGEPIKETASMAEVIVDSTDFILRGSSIACNYDIPDNLKLVDIDKNQISQVIQNIILNAKNAMPQGGSISILCRNVEDITEEQVPLAPENNYIKITISDQGVGISEKIIGKIFEPYFTTKQDGSGLGLSITYSIISKHKGYISASSDPGHGTTFSIYLPASDNALRKPVEPNSNDQKKKLTVLIMDDEEIVRDVSKAMLDALGHEALLAKDGYEAIKLFKNNLDSIDLAIMDLTIPGSMGGKEAAGEILKIAPNAKLVVSSGYSNDPVMAKYKEHGFSAAIVKPYQLEEFSGAINKVTD